jgi:hypothetical protein
VLIGLYPTVVLLSVGISALWKNGELWLALRGHGGWGVMTCARPPVPSLVALGRPFDQVRADNHGGPGYASSRTKAPLGSPGHGTSCRRLRCVPNTSTRNVSRAGKRARKPAARRAGPAVHDGVRHQLGQTQNSLPHTEPLVSHSCFRPPCPSPDAMCKDRKRRRLLRNPHQRPAPPAVPPLPARTAHRQTATLQPAA